jgi:SAM-dependent methyltransferase
LRYDIDKGAPMTDPAPVLWRVSSRDALLTDQWGSPPFTIPLPGAPMREASSVADLGLWYAIGDAWAQMVASRLPAGPAFVLDIGCSCGKVARLLAYNPQVSFLGVDVFAPAIEWCQRAFAAVPRFEFRHLDVASQLYNPDGKIKGSEVKLPAEDASVDVTVAGSLFTHLLEDDFKHYLSEVRRCLKPSGSAVVSLLLAEGNAPVSGDETRIEIGEELFASLARAAGLAIVHDFGNIFGQRVYALGAQS